MEASGGSDSRNNGMKQKKRERESVGERRQLPEFNSRGWLIVIDGSYGENGK